jgi:hypothetical protein
MIYLKCVSSRFTPFEIDETYNGEFIGYSLSGFVLHMAMKHFISLENQQVNGCIGVKMVKENV